MWMFVGIIIGTIIVISVIVMFLLVESLRSKGDSKNDKDSENNTDSEDSTEPIRTLYEILEYEYFYNDNYDRNYENNEYSDEIKIHLRYSYNSTYKICAYGARALKGGKGCALCGNFTINEPLSITFKLGGREAGGKGGEDCGEYHKNDGSRGAGAAIIKYNGEYLIVAGGGGGNSEPEINNGKEKVINRGGNCREDGEGILGGKKGGYYEGGKSGGNGQNGIFLHGGNGASSSAHGMYCGGGGGDGLYGGGAGGYGNKGDNGGGGAGSNYANGNYCKYIEIVASSEYHSGIRIYRYELR